MAHGPTYRVKFRRRREGRTDYYRRRRLLVSRMPRLVVRKTNTRIIVQVVTAHVVGDMTVASAVSSELADYGWQAGTGNLPAAYLTGLLAGRRAKARGIDRAILDIGLNPPIRGSKMYAALKGALDAELEIPHDPEILPPEERIKGEHIVAAFEHFSENPGHGFQFSKLGKKKTVLTGLPKKFESVKKAILEIPKNELKKKKKKPAAAEAKPRKAPAKKKAKKKKKEEPFEKAPRAVPRKPKPKKLVARRGKKGRKR